MLKERLQATPKSHNLKYENYERKNLIGKGKYTVKVVNQGCIKLSRRVPGQKY